MPPAPVRLTRRALEGGRQDPRISSTCSCRTHRDVGPAGSGIPVAVSSVRPSPPLQHHAGRCGDTRRCWDVQGQDVAATTTVPRVAPASGTLEPLSRDYAGSNHDARPAAAPSPSLSTPCGRPCHCRATRAYCYNYSNAIEHAGTGRRHACHCTSYGPLSTAPSSPLGAAPVNHYTSTLKVAPIRAQDAPRRCDWSKIRQGGHQLYGVVRHTATRVEIVRHAC
jgi:hypothetical protein